MSEPTQPTYVKATDLRVGDTVRFADIEGTIETVYREDNPRDDAFGSIVFTIDGMRGSDYYIHHNNEFQFTLLNRVSDV